MASLVNLNLQPTLSTFDNLINDAHKTIESLRKESSIKLISEEYLKFQDRVKKFESTSQTDKTLKFDVEKLQSVATLFVRLAAEKMAGKRQELLDAALATDAAVKPFFKQALELHFKLCVDRGTSRTAFFHVKSGKNILAYLFPAMHNGTDKMSEYPACVEEGLNKCKAVVFEMHASAMTAEDKRTIEELTKHFLSTFNSQELSIFLESTKSNTPLNRDNKGVEEVLGSKAGVAKKKILNLETAKDQEKFLFEEFKLLSQVTPIHPVSGLSLRTDTNLIATELWQLGQTEECYQLAKRLYSVECFNDAIINRNKKMVEKIKVLIEGEQIPLVSVGLAHYGGEEGIINLLRQKGYTIERIN